MDFRVLRQLWPKSFARNEAHFNPYRRFDWPAVAKWLLTERQEGGERDHKRVDVRYEMSSQNSGLHRAHWRRLTDERSR